MTVSYEGVAVPPGRYTARGAARPRYLATVGGLALALGIATAGGVVWDAVVADETTYACPPDCGRPPNSVPVEGLPRFAAPDGAFSVSYPAPGSAYEVTRDADGVTARMTVGDRGVLRLFGEPARGREARQVIDDLLARQFPKAQIAYQLPNAMVGYQPGYGVVATYRQAGVSTRSDTRLVVLAAVKNDLALVALATGPFRRFSAEFGPGPPSAANVEIAIDMGKYVESFSWRGDPAR